MRFNFNNHNRLYQIGKQPHIIYGNKLQQTFRASQLNKQFLSDKFSDHFTRFGLNPFLSF